MSGILLLTLGGAGVAGPPVSTLPLEQLSLGIERTECFGTCPIYRVSISGHGRVTYEGVDHVAVKGIHESQIPVEAVVDLLRRFLDVRFFEAPDVYASEDHVSLDGETLKFGRAFISDNPSTILRLTMGETTKEVVLYHNIPVEYRELADEFDRVAGTARWVHGRE